MPITRDSILSALKAEQEASQKGVPLEVISAEREDAYLVIAAKSGKGRARIAIDDGLEGVRVKWGTEFEHGGIVKFVDADRDRIILEPLSFTPPTAGTTIWLFPNDFLGPLIELWGGEMGKRAAKRLRQTREETEPLQEIKPLPAAFSDLRERQRLAVQNAAYRASLMIGPPGTGKSFTVGALAAYLLTRFSKARMLVVGPTNVAVDTAILAIDHWFARLGRADLAQQIKRVGAHFDPRKYVDRPHLLAHGIAEKATEFLLLEMSEPAKSRVGEYVRWKDRMAAARASLAADIAATAREARIVGVTVSTAVKWQAALTEQAFPFVICDEASQIIGPAAMMMTALGQQTVFAGDPQQLAPIVRTEDKQAEGILGRTAFDVFAHVPTVRLNEQSRMAWAICHAVGATFYENDLAVCKKASRDDVWKAARAPFFVDGREVPRVCFDAVPEPATYSTRYNGFIRFGSAKLVEQIVDELAGSYVEADDILVLTPFRAQRALIQSFLRHRHPTISVSTIHRAQGSERTVVVFDPVDASSQFFAGRDGERLINVAISRAQAHIIIPFHRDDLRHPALAKIHGMSSKLWQTAGKYSRPFSFARAA